MYVNIIQPHVSCIMQ